MGPTGLLPRSQYFTRDHEGALQGEDQLDNREPDGRMASDELSQRDVRVMLSRFDACRLAHQKKSRHFRSACVRRCTIWSRTACWRR